MKNLIRSFIEVVLGATLFVGLVLVVANVKLMQEILTVVFGLSVATAPIFLLYLLIKQRKADLDGKS